MPCQLNETERLRAAETRLQESEGRSHKLQAVVAQLRFQLEEKQQAAVDVTEAVPVPPVAAAPSRATQAVVAMPAVAPAPSSQPTAVPVPDKENAPSAPVASKAAGGKAVAVPVLAAAPPPAEVTVQREHVSECNQQ